MGHNFFYSPLQCVRTCVLAYGWLRACKKTVKGVKSCKKTHANQGPTLKTERFFLHWQWPSHEKFQFHAKPDMVFHSPICIAVRYLLSQSHDKLIKLRYFGDGNGVLVT